MTSPSTYTTASSVKLFLRLCRNVADDEAPAGSDEERLQAVKAKWNWIIKATNFSGVPMFQVNATDLNFLTNLLQSLTAEDVFTHRKFEYIRTQILFAIFIPRPVQLRQATDVEQFPASLERQAKFMGQEGAKKFKRNDK